MLEQLHIKRSSGTKISLELTFSSEEEATKALSALALWFEYGPRPVSLHLFPKDVSIEVKL